MSTFQIDFFELAFLAEACIPPRPIARSMFWQNLTDQYWAQMSDAERAHLFEWMNRNDYYKQSLEKEPETQIFHARFNPDNQYEVKTVHAGKEKTVRAFKMHGDEAEGFSNRYYTKRAQWISPEYIVEINKLKIKTDY
jgi:hypothetical protein